jgi:hypothetical protein
MCDPSNTISVIKMLLSWYWIYNLTFTLKSKVEPDSYGEL